MMPVIQWTPLAQQGLEDIAYYIGVTDGRPAIARKNVEEIVKKGDLYAANPNIGTPHFDLASGLYSYRHKRWLIFYRAIPDGIRVHRVVDGSRDYRRLLP
jgi:plasmid stabilization system protein ParE